MEGQHELEAAKTPKRPRFYHKPQPLPTNVSKSRSAPLPRSFRRGPVKSGGVSYITLNMIRRASDEHELHLITTLNLSGSNLARKIKYIENLDGLRSLHSLNLSHNEIERVEKLGHLRSLVELNLSCNQLPSLDGLENLVQLRVLNVEGNCVSAIPAWLPRKLKQLRTLALARNHIGSLHEISRLHQLSSLTSLTVVDNPISKLSHCTLFIVYHLRTLESLDYVAIGGGMRREAVERFSCGEVDRLEAELLEEREKIMRMEEEMSAMEAAVSREKGPAHVSLQGKDTLSKLQLELQMKNELLAKKTSELALSHQRQYELEQEMTFYKLDAKFDRSRLSELESLLHTSSRFDLETVDTPSSSHEAPYLGRARYKPNSIASETFVHSTPPHVGVHQTVPPPRKPTISKLDLPRPATQTAVVEKSDHQQKQLTFALQALRTILSELRGLTQEGSTSEEETDDAIPDNQVPANDEDMESLTHALDTQMSQMRKLLQNGKDAASELEAQKVLTAARLEKMTLELETLRASHTRVGSTNRRTQTDVLASDDEKLIFELQTKLSKMEKELAEHESAAESLQQELKQLHLEKQSILQSQLDRAPLDMADASSQTDHTHDTVTALEKSVATMNKEREGLQLELLRRTRELEAAMQDIMSLHEELEAAATRSEHTEKQDSQKDAVVKTSSVACQTALLTNTQASMPELLSTPEQMQQLTSLLTELSEKLQNSLRGHDKQPGLVLQSEDPEIVMKLLSLLQDVHHLKTLLQGQHSGRRRKASAAKVRISRSSPEMHTRKHLVSLKKEAGGVTASPHKHGLHGVSHCFVSTSTPKAGQPGKTETVYDRSTPHNRDGLESHTDVIKSQMATRSTFSTEEDSTENKPYVHPIMTKGSKHHDTGGQAAPPTNASNESTLQISPLQAEEISNLAATQMDHEIFCTVSEHQCLEAEVSQLRNCLEEIQLRAKETLQNSRSLHATIEQQTSGLFALYKQRENLSREIRANGHHLVSQARELEVRQAELKIAEEKLQTVLKKKSEAERWLQSLVPSLERDKVSRLSATAAQKRGKLEALVVECSSLEARKHTLAESIEKQQVLYGELVASIDRQEARLAEMSEVLAKLEGRRKAKEEEMAKVQEENEEMQQSARLVASDIQDLKSQKAHLVAEIVEEQSTLSAAKLQLQKHRAALKEVKEVQAKAQSNLSHCRKLTQEAQSGHNSRRQQTQEKLQSAAAMELEVVQSKHAAAVWRLKELQSAIEVKEKELRGWGQKVGEMEEANQRLQQEQRRRQRLLESYNEKIRAAREWLCSQGNHSLEVQHASYSSGLSSRLEELVHRNEKLVQAVHGMKTEAEQHQTDREKERAKYKAAIHKAREEKAALREELQRVRQETDQLRADSSKVEGLLGQYGRQVEQLAGSVASTQQQYEALQSQLSSTTSVNTVREASEERQKTSLHLGVSGSLVRLEDSHQRIMERLQSDNAGLRSEIATLRRQQEESSGRIGQHPTSMAASTPETASFASTESSPMATAVDGMVEACQGILQAVEPGSSLDASLRLQRRLLAARQELTDSRLSHLRTRIASLEGQLKGEVDGTANGGPSEPQPLNQDRNHSSSRDLKGFQTKLEATKKGHT